MRILGIDPGVATVGFGVIDSESGRQMCIRDRGGTVLDCDAVYHQALREDEALRRRIRDAFGEVFWGCLLYTSCGVYPLHIPSPGDYMIYPASMAVAIGERLGLTAVSYTHLDVYKRQM